MLLWGRASLFTHRRHYYVAICRRRLRGILGLVVLVQADPASLPGVRRVARCTKASSHPHIQASHPSPAPKPHAQAPLPSLIHPTPFFVNSLPTDIMCTRPCTCDMWLTDRHTLDYGYRCCKLIDATWYGAPAKDFGFITIKGVRSLFIYNIRRRSVLFGFALQAIVLLTLLTLRPRPTASRPTRTTLLSFYSHTHARSHTHAHTHTPTRCFCCCLRCCVVPF